MSEVADRQRRYEMRLRFRVGMLVCVNLVVVTAATLRAPGAEPAQDSTPTMTNSSVEAAPEPLPGDWPFKAGDAQLRGSSCDSAYGKDGARQFAESGDDVLPIVGTMTTNAGSAYRAVRHTPFLARRDIVRASLVADEDDDSIYQVELALTPDGAAKVKEYTAANPGKCIALVAGGKVLWSATVDAPVEGDVFVLAGAFPGNKGIAIIDLFGR